MYLTAARYTRVITYWWSSQTPFSFVWKGGCFMCSDVGNIDSLDTILVENSNDEIHISDIPKLQELRITQGVISQKLLPAILQIHIPSCCTYFNSPGTI